MGEIFTSAILSSSLILVGLSVGFLISRTDEKTHEVPTKKWLDSAHLLLAVFHQVI
jgi:hypothetical protein